MHGDVVCETAVDILYGDAMVPEHDDDVGGNMPHLSQRRIPHYPRPPNLTEARVGAGAGAGAEPLGENNTCFPRAFESNPSIRLLPSPDALCHRAELS